MGDFINRILYWIAVILSMGFMVFSVIFLVQCGKEDKMDYSAYFKVKSVESDDKIEFSFINKMMQTKKTSFDLLIYGFVFEVKTSESSVDYTVQIKDMGAEETGDKINVDVPRLAYKEIYEYDLYYDKVNEYLQTNGVGGVVKSVNVKDVLFCLLEYVSYEYEGEHDRFVFYDIDQNWDYYFNISSEDVLIDYKIKRTVTITLNNLVEGVDCYYLSSIKFQLKDEYGIIIDQSQTFDNVRVDGNSEPLTFTFLFDPSQIVQDYMVITDVKFSVGFDE